MTNKFEIVIQELLHVIPEIKQVLIVYLYGSVARNDHSLRHSDLDLLIVVDSRSAPQRLQDRINKKLIPLGLKNKVKIHIEYQGITIREQDQTLIRKIIEEGKILYSAGVFNFSHDQIGLKQFIIYTYSSAGSKKRTMLSKSLHGKKSWYYKGKKKIVKEYPGIIDGNSIISLGKGALMVVKQKQQDIEMIFDNYGAEYTIKKIVYA